MFYSYLNLNKVKEIDLDNYTAKFDILGGTTYIRMAIETYGKKYSEQFKCPVTDVGALFQYKEKGEFPSCTIMVCGEIKGRVDIDKETQD